MDTAQQLGTALVVLCLLAIGLIARQVLREERARRDENDPHEDTDKCQS